MFELHPPHDLVVPSSGSTTARAVHSLSRRALFERWKTLEPDPRGGSSGRDAYEALHTTLETFLPGDPHTVSSLFDRPPVSIALRMLRDGLGDPDRVHAELAAQGLFALACDAKLGLGVAIRVAPESLVSFERRLLVASRAPLVFRDRSLESPDGSLALDALVASDDLAPIEGRLVLAFARTAIHRLLGLETTPLTRTDREALLSSCRAARGLLRVLAPSLESSFERFVRVVLPSDRTESTPFVPAKTALGVITIGRAATRVEALRSFVGGVVEHALYSASEHDALFARDATREHDLETLRRACVDAAWLSVVDAARARRDPALADLVTAEYAPGRDGVGEVATELSRAHPTEVGMGILDELMRFARGRSA